MPHQVLLYREAGLDVTLVEAPETGEPALEVINGKAEFGVTGPDILLQRAKGQAVVALAVIFQHSPWFFWHATNQTLTVFMIWPKKSND